MSNPVCSALLNCCGRERQQSMGHSVKLRHPPAAPRAQAQARGTDTAAEQRSKQLQALELWSSGAPSIQSIPSVP
ncbi:hypothetical protein E4U55_007134 [Claviceps digitariae]|nr:hypothetical protein E4U55_007134 [Claviceps digitariae]